MIARVKSAKQKRAFYFIANRDKHILLGNHDIRCTFDEMNQQKCPILAQTCVEKWYTMRFSYLKSRLKVASWLHLKITSSRP
jgi:hypothetical protein